MRTLTCEFLQPSNKRGRQLHGILELRSHGPGQWDGLLADKTEAEKRLKDDASGKGPGGTKNDRGFGEPGVATCCKCGSSWIFGRWSWV
jgi:hypothetical protein